MPCPSRSPRSWTSPRGRSRTSSRSCRGSEKESLDDLDPVYRRLLDEPVTAVIAVMGDDGRPWLTPVWFNYAGDTVLLNLAEHRRKTEWIRRNPQVTMLLMNPENPYHWVSLKATVEREVREDDPAEGPPGHRDHRPVVDQVHRRRAALRPPRPGHGRAAGPVRVPRRQRGRVRPAVGRPPGAGSARLAAGRGGRGLARWAHGRAGPARPRLRGRRVRAVDRGAGEPRRRHRRARRHRPLPPRADRPRPGPAHHRHRPPALPRP